MHKCRQLITVKILTLLIALAVAAPARAQGDPTATPPFLTPTPWGRPTPTLWQNTGGDNLAAGFAFDSGDTGELADNIINGYNWLDQSGAVTTGIFFMMSMLIIGLIMRVFRRSKEL